MNQPEGYTIDQGLVCKLNKSIYSLKQSSKNSNNCFNEHITNLGFLRSKADYCLYSRVTERTKMYVILCDDLILMG
jgi:hypothetical protein